MTETFDQTKLRHLIAENARLRRELDLRKRMKKFAALIFSPDEIHDLRIKMAEQTTFGEEAHVFEQHVRTKLADAPPRILEEIFNPVSRPHATTPTFVSYTWDDRWY